MSGAAFCRGCRCSSEGAPRDPEWGTPTPPRNERGPTREGDPEPRQADAELSKLTLRAQHAVTAQRKLGNGRVADIYNALIQVALNGAREHARVAASKLLLDLARAAVEREPHRSRQEAPRRDDARREDHALCALGREAGASR
jgi:hypothetical protein